MYFKHDSGGKGRRKFFGSGDECFENVCTKGHKTETIATVKYNGSSFSKGHYPVGRIIFVTGFFSLYTMQKLIHSVLL
jgi:hypothetical protein